MRNRSPLLKSLLTLLPSVSLAAFLLFSPGGCAGGGTAGTGGITYSGSVVGDSTLRAAVPVPLVGVKVSVAGEDGFATTDNQGQFLLASPNRRTSAELVLEGSTFQSNYLIPKIPAAASQVKVQLAIQADESVTEESKKFEDDEGNEVNENEDEEEAADESSGGSNNDSDNEVEDGSDGDNSDRDDHLDDSDSSDGEGEEVTPTPGNDDGEGEDSEDSSEGDDGEGSEDPSEGEGDGSQDDSEDSHESDDSHD